MDAHLASYLNADPLPSFIIPIDLLEPSPFHLLFCNNAFKQDSRLTSLVLGDDKFKDWCQTVNDCRDHYEFANHSWTAFTFDGQFKSIRTSATGRKSTGAQEPTINDHVEEKLVEASMAITKLQGLERIFEISQIGTFEYDPSGELIRANEAYYQLCGYPKDRHELPDFSFMDLVYPPDREQAMSFWFGTLLQGKSAYFEIRVNSSRTPLTTATSSPMYGSTPALNSGFDDEDFLWIIVACAPIMDDAGNVICICGNTADISAQKRVQAEALRRAEALERAEESEWRFQQLAKSAPIGIFIFDGHQKFKYCNRHFFNITGHPPTDDLEEIDWRKFMHPDDVYIAAGSWKTLLEDKKPSVVEGRTQKVYTSADGVQRQAWVHTHSFPEFDSDGNVIKVLGTVYDITKYKEVEELQQIRIEEALEAKRQKENFIDATSHELRNPLSAVLQCADSAVTSLERVATLLSRRFLQSEIQGVIDNVAEEARSCMDAVQTIISCALHQKRVIDDTLTLSKLDSNLMIITPVRSQAVIVVKQVMNMFKVECSKEDIALNFHEDHSLRDLHADWAMFDPSRLHQVLINLLTNAIKFTRGRPRKVIEVTLGATLERPGDHWNGIRFADHRTIPQDIADNPEWGTGQKLYLWVKVSDTGCGLTPHEQCRLFTKFTQASPKTHVEYGGSGLGLYISKSITELCSGNIGVASTPEVGSTFAFFIGTRLSTSPSPEQEEESMKPVRQLSFPAEEASNTGSVLLVEDNLVNQKVLSKQLGKAGFTVHIAGHGVEALTFLRKTKFWRGQATIGLDLAAVLMDVEMPVMDGLECARRIRELEESGEIVSHVPIMAVSANARAEQLKLAKESGMDDAIAKPFRIAELLPKIEMLTRRWSTGRSS